MSFSQKIDLENFIFARAAFCSVEVDAVRGELQVGGTDILLHVLACVYNAFFAEENEQIAQESAWEEYGCLGWWNVFDEEENRLGPLGRSGTVLCFLERWRGT